MYYKAGQKVQVNKDIFRQQPKQIKYATKGEIGEIVEIFYPQATGKWEDKPLPYAKVMINNQIKTFRLTSLQQI